MATVSPTRTDLPPEDGSVLMYSWALTSTNTDGAPIEWVQYADRSISFVGTWGGATAALEGSNDGSTWLPITDPQGTAISKTGDALEAATELTRYVRPNLTTAGTGAAITATMILRRANPMRT